jgi:peptidyl-prolyl cis-trans isomerase SurA
MKMCLLGINNSSIKDMLKKMLFAIVFILSLAINSFGSLKDDVLLVVHGREITRNEFLYHLRKNYQEVNQRNVEIFLDEFIILQLKLAQAIEEGIHHNIGFINELTEYRIILSSPYLTDNEKQQEFVNEALERLKYEIKIDQILVKYEANNNIDTLNAFRKAGEIRKRLLNGESFEEVAKLYLGDGFIIYKPNKDVFISAFETEYHIESAAFNLKKDEISMPVKSKNGYSIIQLSDKTRITKNSKNRTGSTKSYKRRQGRKNAVN